jgi:ATP-binding cassette subfamily B protein
MPQKEDVRKERLFPSLRTLSLFPKASLPFTLAIAFLLVMSVASSLLQMVVFGALVNAIGPAAREGFGSAEGRRLIQLLILAGGLNIGIGLLANGQSYLITRFTMRFQLFLQQMGMRAALEPKGIAHMEDPEFLNEFELAIGMERFGGPANVLPQMVSLLQIRLVALGSAAILIGLAWWAPVSILLAAAFGYRWLLQEMDLIFELAAETSSESRRALYFRDLIVSPEPAKEIRVFGMADWALNRYVNHWSTAMSGIWRERRKLNSQMILAGVIFAAAYGVVFFEMARRTVSGEISVGEMAVYAQAAFVMTRLVQEGSPIYMTRSAANSILHLVDLPNIAKRLKPFLVGSITDTAGLPANEIQLQGVEFAYPGTTAKVIEGLNLSIPAGKSLAIVGSNGAGKTTLIKLLVRLYDADAGSITVDDVDLKTIDPAAWRRRVGVIFQDFLRFPLTARDNVGFGDLDSIDDDAALKEAASLSGAASIIESLPKGWDTVLSKEFSDGVDLSGGEWQKIALARAMFAARRGGVLVLDEPTANLDVRAEAELFDRFLDLTRGVTTILISHRFSSVRRADRICVLDDGRIVEEGSHEDLMRRGGQYHKMFSLQAARFETTEEVSDG